MPNVFLLLNSTSTGYRTLELANIYHSLPETRYAHPNFGFRAIRMNYKLYDHYNDYQFHLKKVIGLFNSASVWDFAGLSKEVTVAVIDDGVDIHEDLQVNRILPGYDFTSNDNDPRPSPLQAHGIACSGIIAASHTVDSTLGLLSSSGVISINPKVNILPVRIFGDSGATSNDAIAEAVTYAYTHGADILSNSWGYRSIIFDYPVLTEALERASLFGRDGCGCAVIFSAGNDSWLGGISYPAKLNFCFAVGATELDDNRWYYSQYGYDLDIVAPSGDVNLQGDVWSLDQMSDFGWNPTYFINCPPTGNDKDYDCHFGGTSAACPVVSGVASLLLAKDSTLSAQAVYYILKNSAEKDLDWGPLPDTPSVEYGYGRVDAFRAILSISHGNVDNIINHHGDAIDVADLSYLVDYLFQGGQAPFPSDLLADCNCNNTVDVSDLNYLIDFLFAGGPLPINPCFKF